MKEFFKPWMKRCEPNLIYRLWRKKGCPGQLTIDRGSGLEITHIETQFGELNMFMGDKEILSRFCRAAVREGGTVTA